MTGSEYQKLASRTMRTGMIKDDLEYHALHGMVAEIGELHSIYQKFFQGHDLKKDHMKKELGDLLWFVAEYCTALGWNLDDVMQTNIDKLQARYPNGFESKRSLNRKEEDI